MSAHSDSPETDIYAAHKNDVYEFVDPEWDWVVSADSARHIQRQRNEARAEVARLQMELETLKQAASVRINVEHTELRQVRELLASEKSTRNTIIAKGIETEKQLAEAREAFVIATDQLVQVQSELRQMREAFAHATARFVQVQSELQQVREENARLREALENCREDSIELLGERDWWKEEPRCGYQERYAQTAKNIQIADALLTT